MNSKRSSTSVRVTNYPDQDDSNPEPVSVALEPNTSGFLSPQTLKAMTGTADLDELTSLELSVNAQEISIGSMGGMVPHLERLRLVQSYVPSVRDLGTGFSRLRYLWLSRCGLEDLDGISCFSCIYELYLSYNEISDLSPLSLLESLQVLDLEGNNVDDISQVEFLGFCSNLYSLVLEGNPVEKSPCPDCSEEDQLQYNYRAAVVESIPSLKYLDEEAVVFEIINGTKVVKKKENSTDKESIIIQDCIKYADQDMIEEEETEEGDNGSIIMTRPMSAAGVGRPLSAAGRSRPQSAARMSRTPSASIAGRPSSAANKVRPASSARTSRPMSAIGSVHGSNSERLQTASRPSTASGGRSPIYADFAGLSNHSSSENLDEDGSSDLTHGSKKVLCGNPVRALLARRKELIGSLRTPQSWQVEDRADTERFLQDTSTRFIPEHSYFSKEEESRSDDNILKELKEWRRKFARHLDDPDDATSPPTIQDSMRSEVARSPTSISPAPPSSRPQKTLETSHQYAPKQIFPNGDIPERPSTVSSFRSRRYKPGSSTDNSRDNSNSPTHRSSPESGILPDRPTIALFTRPMPPNRSPFQNRSSVSPKSRLRNETNNNHSAILGDDSADTRPVTAMAALQRRTRLRKEK